MSDWAVLLSPTALIPCSAAHKGTQKAPDRLFGPAQRFISSVFHLAAAGCLPTVFCSQYKHLYPPSPAGLNIFFSSCSVVMIHFGLEHLLSSSTITAPSCIGLAAGQPFSASSKELQYQGHPHILAVEHLFEVAGPLVIVHCH